MHRTAIPTFAASLLAGAALVASALAAQDAEEGEKKDEKWDVNAPRGATITQVPISVDEGTWMDVDVSPGGQRGRDGLGRAAQVLVGVRGRPLTSPPYSLAVLADSRRQPQAGRVIASS